MNNITELIRKRRSVRTYDEQSLKKEDVEKLCSFAETINNPYGIPVQFKMMDAKECGLSCPVVVGTDLYIGGKIKSMQGACAAFGYSFETLILFAQSLGIGTVWLGGTMNRAAFEKGMDLKADEFMPCASSLGYPAKKMSLRESMMRKAIKADKRLPFEELFFERTFATSLTKVAAGQLAEPLEMVRLAPSAVNKQPWRVVVDDNSVHFYIKRSKGFNRSSELDMQMIDIGIALCHFALTAEEKGLKMIFVQEEPQIATDGNVEYVASYKIV